MRTVFAVAVVMLLIAGCGGEDKIAITKKKVDDLRTQYKSLNAEKAEKMTAWQEVKNKVIPLRSTYLRAKGTDGEAAAKQAYQDAQSAADEVIQLENVLTRKIRDLKDEIMRLGGKP